MSIMFLNTFPYVWSHTQGRTKYMPKGVLKGRLSICPMRENGVTEIWNFTIVEVKICLNNYSLSSHCPH